MPNTKSAIRRVKRVKRQSLVNKLRRSRYKLAIKKINKLIEKKDVKEMKADMNRWKGAGGIIILLGGLIGSVFYWSSTGA